MFRCSNSSKIVRSTKGALVHEKTQIILDKPVAITHIDVLSLQRMSSVCLFGYLFACMCVCLSVRMYVFVQAFVLYV